MFLSSYPASDQFSTRRALQMWLLTQMGIILILKGNSEIRSVVLYVCHFKRGKKSEHRAPKDLHYFLKLKK